ncbi:MAG: LuxR C-terminal-related transcriptional regulator [Syntrophobacteraceae bacterium]
MDDTVPTLESMAGIFHETISRGINFHCNVIDRNYRIVWHNEVADEGRRVGLLCHEFYQKRKGPCKNCPVRKVFESGQPCVIERERSERLPSGLPRWGEIRAYPIPDRDGATELVVTIGFDITEKKLAASKRQSLIARLQKRIERLSRARSAAPASSEANPFRLTSRELQVLNLVAQGLSNNETADILSLSPHTVKSHLTHIFDKLGVNDRTEAAILAASRDLI